MKFSQSDLTKLAISAGAGYLGASLLIPSHRGFAAGGHCNKCGTVGKDQTWDGYVTCCRGRSPGCACPDIGPDSTRSGIDKLMGPNKVVGGDVVYPKGSPVEIAGGAGSDWSEHNIGAPTRAGLDSIAKGLEQAFKDVQCPPFMSFLGPNCKYWPIILIGGFAGIMILSKI